MSVTVSYFHKYKRPGGNDLIKFSPSILAADRMNMGAQVDLMVRSGAAFIHVDVMDGHFVPNLSFGPAMVKSLHAHTKCALDVHLMIEKPDRYIKDFAAAGADYLTIHAESQCDIKKTLQDIRALGMKAGISINPDTDVSALSEVIGLVDLVLVMTVVPGFGGQELMQSCVDKIAPVRKMLLDAQNTDALIEVDGGVNPENAPAIAKAGADVIVMGTALFGAPDPAKVIQAVRQACAEAAK